MHSTLPAPVLPAYADGITETRCHTAAGEATYRAAFLESASRALADRTWGTRRTVEILARLRQRTRRRAAIFGPAGEFQGFRPHAEEAARLRGLQHGAIHAAGWEIFRRMGDEVLTPSEYERQEWWARAQAWAASPDVAPPPRSTRLMKPDVVATPEPPKPKPKPENDRRVKLTRADSIEMRPPDWLLRGMLERDSNALLFGESSGGKSFVSIDWACRIATGTPWRDYPVKAGPVVYLAGEGRQGIGRRIRAWSEHNKVPLAGVPLFVGPAVAIPSEADLLGLVHAIDTGVATVGKPALIVLDTLARTFGGGDENSTQDMSAFVSACDALRHRYGCTILTVHHVGQADKSRARGASALKASLDAEYRLGTEAGLVLSTTKMKDAEAPPPLALRLVSVELPGLLDEDGNPVTSAAVELLDVNLSGILAKVGDTKRGKLQALGEDVARRLVGQADDGQVALKDWHQACEDAGMPRSTRYDVLAKLIAAGTILVNGERIEIPCPLSTIQPP